MGKFTEEILNWNLHLLCSEKETTKARALKSGIPQAIANAFLAFLNLRIKVENFNHIHLFWKKSLV